VHIYLEKLRDERSLGLPTTSELQPHELASYSGPTIGSGSALLKDDPFAGLRDV
jgi:hypothetical protein